MIHGNAPRRWKLRKSVKLIIVTTTLVHSGFIGSRVRFDASLLRGVRTQVILECTYVSKDSIIQAWWGMRRGGYSFDVSYIYSLGQEGGIEGPTFVMSCFVERPVSVPSCLETGGTLKTSLYLCDKESYSSIVYIFLWVFFLLHIVFHLSFVLVSDVFYYFFLFDITLFLFLIFLLNCRACLKSQLGYCWGPFLVKNRP